jgi:hypothetical protein
MGANDIQHGGSHYKNREYQHWDWVCDINLHYLLGCATKYVSRWREKNGVEDLHKAIHYLQKAMERHVPDRHAYVGSSMYSDYYRQFPAEEEEILKQIIAGHYQGAVTRIERLISDAGLPEDHPHS